MEKYIISLILIILTIFTQGCQTESQKSVNSASTENITISDLAPELSNPQGIGNRLKTINFNAYIFNLPISQEKILDQILQGLYKRPLRINYPQPFEANYFKVAMGQFSDADKVAYLIKKAGGDKVKTNTLMIGKQSSELIPIRKIEKPQTIFYFGKNNDLIGSTLTQGNIVLRLNAEKIEDKRGVCNVSAMPVFIPKKAYSDKIAENNKRNITFDSVEFSLNMVPGQFLIISPKKNPGNQKTLGSLFFSNNQEKPGILIMMIMCMEIID